MISTDSVRTVVGIIGNVISFGLFLSPLNQRKLMASWKLPLLPALFISVILMVPSHCTVDLTSTTLAISQATGTVCGITARSQNHRVHCARFPELDNWTASSPIHANISFEAISGGPYFICGLWSGGSAFFCWDGIGQRVKRVYKGPSVLNLLSVGANHTAAIDGDRTKIQWWRYGCGLGEELCRHSQFPTNISGEFYYLTSGDDFACALNRNFSVHCWGPGANQTNTDILGKINSNITAGGSRLCGLNTKGHLICTGDQAFVPSGEAFEFTSLAIGSSQTCAISRRNGSVICWGRQGAYFPMGNTGFELIVAGGDITCGLTSYTRVVACWGLDGANTSVIRSLPRILPGVCVSNKSICHCGYYSDSGDLCGGSGYICKKYGTATTDFCKFSPPGVNIWKRLLSSVLGKLIASVVIGLFGMGIFFVYWFVRTTQG